MNRRTLARDPRALAGSFFLFAGLAVFALGAKAQTATLPSTGTIAVPTYEAVGLTWQSPGASSSCEVKYRVEGQSTWQQGLPMWYDSRDQQCRGSLVNLTPGTAYQVEFNLPGQAATRGLAFSTWSNRFPVAKTIAVASGSGTLNITEGGSPSGYVVYEGNGATLDAANVAQFNVTVNASYVIVRGLTLKGAKQDAIRINATATDVVIEDNDISGWGRQRSGNWGIDMDSAVRGVCTQPTMQRVTVQRNRMYNPRYSANSWSDGHPAGPQAVTFSYCGGNHVIRHNEMFSTNGNYFNDILGGEDNFTLSGFPNADTDIYGNKMSHAWDDAIEAEGANENVRIWGNYMDRTAIGVATTVTSIGPAYVFRNVWNRSQFFERPTSLDTDDRQPFFKSGSDSSLGFGRRYFFHNTMLQAQQAGLQYGLGGGYGMGGTGSTQLITNTHSKNNIYHLWKPGKSAFYQTGAAGTEVANDMYNGTAGDATIVNGINATPVYAAGHGWQAEAGGNYQLDPTSPGFGRGVKIPNFNDDAAAPDVGAHQSGSASMKFGIAASPGSAVGAASTTPPPPPPATPTTYSIGVTFAGTGSGSVGSSPSGLECNATCSRSFAAGTALTLTAVASSGSVFAGWSGACTGTGACTVTMNQITSVTATFNASATTPPPAPTGGVTMSASTLSFTATSATQAVTFTNNTGVRVTFITASMSSAKFGQSNNCGEVAPGASCTATVTYYPTNSGSDTGTLTLTSTAPNSPHVVNLSGTPGTTTEPAPTPTTPPSDCKGRGKKPIVGRCT